MLIIGTFEHSMELEELLALLEHNSISRKHILVAPMDTNPKSPTQFISKSRDLHYKGIELGMVFATASSVVGTSVGFILPWGPIISGLIAALIGFTIGFTAYLLIHKGTHRNLPKKLPEITVIVQCQEDHSALVMDNMWKFHALTVGRMPEPIN